MGWRTFLALAGGAGVVVFLVFVLRGEAKMMPFAAAFAGAAASETIVNRAVLGRPFDWKAALFAIAGIAVYAGLTVWAFRLARSGESDGGLSVVLGLMSGNFLADALTRKTTEPQPEQPSIG